MLMEFEKSGAYHIATNALKHVVIDRSPTGYWLSLPHGDLYSSNPGLFCYHTFEEAVKHAETKVGIKMNFGA